MKFKRIALISIGLNVMGLLLFAGRKTIYRPQPPKTESPDAYYDKWNQARKSVLDMLPIDSTDIVFVGNSITEGFPLQEMFPGFHVKNRGIGGNQSRHILGRIQEIAAGHPRKIFIDIGVNDLRDHILIDSILHNCARIIEAVRFASPRTTIYVQSVFPVGPANKEIKDSIPAFNIELRHASLRWQVNFIDLYPLFLQGEYIRPALTFDDLHLTGAGYALWRQAIVGYLP